MSGNSSRRVGEKRHFAEVDEEAAPSNSLATSSRKKDGIAKLKEHVLKIHWLVKKMEDNDDEQPSGGLGSAGTHPALGSSAALRLPVRREEVIHLNVGGVPFDVPRKTLLSEPNSLFHALFDDLLGTSFALDTDENGFIILDRDPIAFRHILNFLRGYRRFAHLSPEDLTLVLNDADFYHLPALRELLQPSQAAPNLFIAGPGVNYDRNRLRVQYGVGIIGDKPLIAGRHSVTFQILNDHYVGLGVVSDSCVATDQEFHKQPSCAVYYMTGVFYSNFPNFKKEENLEKFESGDVVTMTLDMNDRTLEFEIRGKPPKIVSCGTATSLRFAVAMKLTASVRILNDGVPPVGNVVTAANLASPQQQAPNEPVE